MTMLLIGLFTGLTLGAAVGLTIGLKWANAAALKLFEGSPLFREQGK